MPILQISQIKHRRGLQENLPQLGSAEFGFAVDSRRLFIGSGTREEGAPIEENIEILTEASPAWIEMQSQREDSEFNQGLDPGLNQLTGANGKLNNIVQLNEEDNYTGYTPSILIKYQITVGNNSRTGIFKASKNIDTRDICYEDDYVETADMGISIVAESNSIVPTNMIIVVNSVSTGIISYEIDVYKKNLSL